MVTDQFRARDVLAAAIAGGAATLGPLPIRADRGPAEPRRLERDGRVAARLLALANALEGIRREEAARLAGMTGQTLGDRAHLRRTRNVE